ncbi:MAG: pyrroline-5-carboxylate reductase [Anaerolineae bacterium]|jgi:pyrroline-5-carboxylate reductase|nr:pyrroline-5-carboxylate reductase [Anaerolineae bacterium]MBT4311884.1 pyrroline-5-carboxylate reductase [Anaerolineae bacterium]MBT4458358.1 pyrroline-5-carboxylate reductase [Anaerolineae bacterium]MBT6059901.1 pyrroline-5-carboxylate reductase [Anaerolineae bacterium]MBT6323069.1 pyrroline-5-carboxylate reductase [Anaerolineae bacterium]
MSKIKIAFIGSGAMAGAMIVGLLREKLASPENLFASDPREKRGEELREKYGIQPFTDNVAAVKDADVVVLSIKPQRLSAVLEGLKGSIPKNALVLSIIAGATIEKISTDLGHGKIVRTMPNTPARIGEGITVWVASDAVSESQKEQAQKILSALGDDVFVEDEYYLDMATALSGSGPAYVYMFMEAMIDAGVHMGFPRRISEKLVVQTMRGSVNFYEKNDVHVAALRNQVTSSGGTSAEALYYLEKAGVRTAISRAIWAAYQRSLELGREKKEHVPKDQ